MKKALLIVPLLLAMVGAVFAQCGDDCSETTFDLDVVSNSEDLDVETDLNTYGVNINTDLDVEDSYYTTSFSQDAYVEDCSNEGWLRDTWNGQVNEYQSVYASGSDVDYSRDVYVYDTEYSEDLSWYGHKYGYEGESNYYYDDLSISTSNGYYHYDIDGNGGADIDFNVYVDNGVVSGDTELDYGYDGSWCIWFGCWNNQPN